MIKNNSIITPINIYNKQYGIHKVIQKGNDLFWSNNTFILRLKNGEYIDDFVVCENNEGIKIIKKGEK